MDPYSFYLIEQFFKVISIKTFFFIWNKTPILKLIIGHGLFTETNFESKGVQFLGRDASKIPALGATGIPD